MKIGIALVRQVGTQISERVVNAPSGPKQVVANQNQLDIGTFGGGGKATRTRELDLGIISEVDQEARDLASSIGVAVDHHGPG